MMKRKRSRNEGKKGREGGGGGEREVRKEGKKELVGGRKRMKIMKEGNEGRKWR